MGANLIVFIAIGPKKFPKKLVKRAVNHALSVQKRAKRLNDLLNKESPDGKAHADVELLWDSGAFAGLRDQEGVGSAFEAGSYIDQMANANTEKLVKDFVQWWEHLEGRDTAGRTCPTNPKQQIVVCGDTSYGDAPEGYGYETMKAAYWYGVPEMLGVH